MKKWFAPLAVLALLVIGATSAAFAVGGGDDGDRDSADGISLAECSLVHNVEACKDEGVSRPDPGQ